MTEKVKMPLSLKGAWLNLVLVLGWFFWSVVEGYSFSWLWLPYFALTFGILYGVDYVARRGGYGA